MQKIQKNDDTFLVLNQPILTILMWKKVQKMTFEWFTTNVELWSKKSQNPPLKTIFRPQMSIFGHFQKFHLWVFSRNIEGRRNFDRQNSRKKVENVLDLPYKYLSVWTITFWDIAIRDRAVFLYPHSRKLILWELVPIVISTRKGTEKFGASVQIRCQSFFEGIPELRKLIMWELVPIVISMRKGTENPVPWSNFGASHFFEGSPVLGKLILWELVPIVNSRRKRTANSMPGSKFGASHFGRVIQYLENNILPNNAVR